MTRIYALFFVMLACAPACASEILSMNGAVTGGELGSLSQSISNSSKKSKEKTLRNVENLDISSTVAASNFCKELSKCAREKPAVPGGINSVSEFGAAGDGSDQTSAIKAAQSATKSNVLRFPAGSYRSDGSVPHGPEVDTAYEMIAPHISGYLPNIQDGLAANASVRLWTVPWGSRFAHGLALQGINHPSKGTSSYERTGFVFRYEQRDPSSYGAGGADRDLVGTDWQGVISPGNITGRIWGTSTTLAISPGADGYAIMHEGGIINNGTAQPLMNTPTSKVGVQMVADGTANLTAGYTAIASGRGAKWAHAFYVDATAVERNAFVLRQGASGPDLASISATGVFQTVSDASIGGKVGFNGAAPTGKCRLPAKLPTDGSASNAALASAFNAVRDCLVTVGLAQ
jgi:hypothetical protein